MLPQVRSNKTRFRRTPSRCQRFWQGILVLATLALAIAANAQSACVDVFSPTNAPLRRGNSVTLEYSFPEVSATVFANPSLRAEIASSAIREQSRLRAELPKVKDALKPLIRKTSKNALMRRAKLESQIDLVEKQLARAVRIQELAEDGQVVLGEDLILVQSYKFRQTIALKGKAQANFMLDRLADLKGHLATWNPVHPPPGKIKRILRVMIKHYVVTLILVSSVSTGAYQLYQSHVAQKAADNAPIVTQIFDEGLGNAPIVAPKDDPSLAVGE